MSTVTSELCYMEGHRKRWQLLLALDNVIADGLDVYGRKHGGGILESMCNYRGELEDKYDGLTPYEYHVNCENSFADGYFTEKLLDPIIAESLCFYDGCTDIERYVDERAFGKIDVNNIEQSIDLIIRTIEEEWTTKQKLESQLRRKSKKEV